MHICSYYRRKDDDLVQDQAERARLDHSDDRLQRGDGRAEERAVLRQGPAYGRGDSAERAEERHLRAEQVKCRVAAGLVKGT